MIAMGVAGSEHYNTAIEAELTARLGVRFVPVHRGRGGKEPVREIEGIDPRLITEFSGRRKQIDAVLEQLVADYRSKYGVDPSRAEQHRFAQQANLETRAAKEKNASYSARHAQWVARAAAVMGGQNRVEQMVAAALTPSRGTATMSDEHAVDAILAWEQLRADPVANAILPALVARRSTWKRNHVLAEAQRAARRLIDGPPAVTAAQVHAALGPDRGVSAGLPDDVTVAELAQQLAEWTLAACVELAVDSDAVPTPKELQRADGRSVYEHHNSREFTTTQVLADEERLVAAATMDAGPRISPEAVELAIATLEDRPDAYPLDAGQKVLAHHFATGGHLVEAGIGPAGAGKTTAMRAFVEAARLAGHRVVGVAPSAAAAAVMADDLGIQTDTAAMLAQPVLDADKHAHLALDEHTFVLVDEAGMADTDTLTRILHKVTQAGAGLRLLGDPAQLQAVGAGGVLRLIETRVGAAHLDRLHRFADPVEADATLLLREGREAGLSFYIDNNRVRGGLRDDMLTTIYEAWKADTATGQVSVMLASSNDDVTALNARARTERVLAGTVEADGTGLHNGSLAGVGDLVVTRYGDRRLRYGRGSTDYVKNGDVWQVLARRPDGQLQVRHTTHQRTITLPASYVAENVELAYASTVHRAQGMTVESSHTLIDAAADRSTLYTGATRGRYSNRFYVVTGDLLDADLHHQPGHVDTIRAALESVFARTNTDNSATAIRAREQAKIGSLAVLVPAYEDALARVLDPDREERLSAVVAHVAGTEHARLILDDPAWASLRDRLATHEAAGGDPASILAAA